MISKKPNETFPVTTGMKVSAIHVLTEANRSPVVVKSILTRLCESGNPFFSDFAGSFCKTGRKYAEYGRRIARRLKRFHSYHTLKPPKLSGFFIEKKPP